MDKPFVFGCFQSDVIASFLYVSVYLIMCFQQFVFLIDLLLTICILLYVLLLYVIINRGFVFTLFNPPGWGTNRIIVDTVYESI